MFKKQKSAPAQRRRQVWSQEPARRSRKPQLKKARQGGVSENNLKTFENSTQQGSLRWNAFPLR